MPAIFVSYRRADSQDITARLVDGLAKLLSDELIFRDIYDISPGRDFTAALREALMTCDIVLSVIGPRWLMELNRRLDLHEQKRQIDWVHEEVATAIQRGCLILPVLVHEASMPAANDLPDDLKFLAAIPPIQFDQTAFQGSIDALVKRLLEYPQASSLTQHLLEQAFNFNQDDLNQNRMGRTSMRQSGLYYDFTDDIGTKWAEPITMFVLIALLIASVGLGLLISKVGASNMVAIGVAGCLATPIIVVITFLFLMSSRHVRVMRDQITLSNDKQSIRVGNCELELLKGQNPEHALRLLSNRVFTVYRTDYHMIDNAVLSAEISEVE